MSKIKKGIDAKGGKELGRPSSASLPLVYGFDREGDVEDDAVVTVLEVIQRSTEFLAKRDVESPRLQAELLLAHALKVPRMKLYLDFERVLNPAEVEAVREMVKRRGDREPLQHITGSVSFCGIELVVNRNVLVPRPETELLAELGWSFLNAEFGVRSAEVEALDFGTGSGCLAIALAVKCLRSKVTAIDVSGEALVVARQNAERHGVVGRIEFVESDGFAALGSGSMFDLVLANPPYIASGEIASLEPEVRKHDPRLALDGGEDGLEFYRRLAGECAGFLRPGGRLMAEFGDGQAAAIKKIFEEQMWIVEAIKADYSGKERILTARKIEPGTG